MGAGEPVKSRFSEAHAQASEFDASCENCAASALDCHAIRMSHRTSAMRNDALQFDSRSTNR